MYNHPPLQTAMNTMTIVLERVYIMVMMFMEVIVCGDGVVVYGGSIFAVADRSVGRWLIVVIMAVRRAVVCHPGSRS